MSYAEANGIWIRCENVDVLTGFSPCTLSPHEFAPSPAPLGELIPLFDGRFGTLNRRLTGKYDVPVLWTTGDATPDDISVIKWRDVEFYVENAIPLIRPFLFMYMALMSTIASSSQELVRYCSDRV